MPISYAIDKPKRLLVCCAWGTFNASQAQECRRQISEDPDFDPTFALLADFTAVATYDITPGEIRRLASANPFSPDSRRAFVAPSPLAFGLARIFETLRSLRGDRYIRVFHNRDEALAWIFVKEEAA